MGGGVGWQKWKFGVSVRFMVMSRYLSFAVVGLGMALATGCATQGSSQVGEAAPVSPPVLTTEQQADKAEARQAYMACLKQAAHFAEGRAIAAGDVAEVIAPMCYPQFSQYEIAAAAGMDGHAWRLFDREGDKRQLEFAAEAIGQEHGLAALSPDK
jgi:hypothetical protein